MIKIEDFENAPVGTTATRSDGHRAMKMNDGVRGWITPKDSRLSDKGMIIFGYVLDPSPATAAREALDHAWELAHPVKEGWVIPEGTRYLTASGFGIKEYTASRDFKTTPEHVSVTRTLERLPDPEPDWLDAPAVFATTDWCAREVWLPQTDGQWKCTCCHSESHWSNLEDVIPLYPKEVQEA